MINLGEIGLYSLYTVKAKCKIVIYVVDIIFNPIQSKLFWRRSDVDFLLHSFFNFNPNLMKLSEIDHWGMLYLLVVTYWT